MNWYKANKNIIFPLAINIGAAAIITGASSCYILVSETNTLVPAYNVGASTSNIL